MKTGYERVTNYIPPYVDIQLVPGDSDLHKYDTKNQKWTAPGNITCADVDSRHTMRTSPDTSILMERGN